MKRLLGSLRGRLLLGSLLLLPLFLAGSSLYLERSHRVSLEAATIERLQLQIYTLLAQADYTQAFSLPEALLEGRLNQPDSGLYARVFDAWGTLLWQSPSAITLPPTDVRTQQRSLPVGERRFSREDGLFHLAYQVSWETESGLAVPLRFTVMETTAAVDAEVASYRRSLLFWLGGAASLLILCQLGILSWGLRPLRRLAGDIAAVEAGERATLPGPYPAEVQPVTDNLALLLRSEEQRRERVRETMADLAHSLKTPLAVLNSGDPAADDYPRLVQEQVQRMQEIVSYQLQRSVSGGHRLLQPLPLAPLLQRLADSLHRVYADKAPQIRLQVGDRDLVRGDERDLLELLGNVLDNACKYCHSRVEVSVTRREGELEIAIADDGEGLPAAQRDAVLQRGMRLDSRREGQGLGLAVAADIAASYGGSLVLEDADLGGLCVRVSLPA